ncbi:MAG: aspartate aminotransferase family protein [Candidatus Eisenbacteria bacterium]
MTAPESERLRFIEPDGSNREEIRRLGYRFIDLLVEAASDAVHRPPVPDDGEAAAFPARYEPPATGRPAEDLLEAMRDGVLRHVLNPAHPGYVGHMDSLASAVGIFSDAIVSACNNNMLSYEMSLLFTTMEQAILAWSARSFGWGEGAGGFLVSGGTLANIQAIWTARNARAGEGIAREGVRDGARGAPVVIASENAHYSFRKAANLLGIGREGLRLVPTDRAGRVRPEAMERAVVEAKREGKIPFCIIGIAGTTVTGSIEPLPEIGEIARRHGLWYHVDAAYGGSLILSGALRGRLAGCEHADSITWNPQKWLYVPKTCASLLYRDLGVLDRTIRETFVYGREQAPAGQTNLGEYTMQGTRRVDVLKLWLTLEHFGMSALGGLIETLTERARWLADRIEAAGELDLIGPPDLNIVCFRALPRGVDPEDGPRVDAIQEEVQKEVARRGHGWISIPRYQGRRILRAVILHPRCDTDVLASVLADVREAAAAARR